MRVVPARRDIALLLAAMLAVAAATVLTQRLPGEGSARAATWCSGVMVTPGDDLDARVNADPAGTATTFCIDAAASGTVYSIDQTLTLWSGDRLIGRPGSVTTRGPASYGTPLVKIRPSTSLRSVVRLEGPATRLRWLDISGAPAGVQAVGANAQTLFEYVTIHDTSRLAIGQMAGRLMHSHLYRNGTNPDTWGVDGSAVKGLSEYEAGFNYVHDNPANGLWCDHGCTDAGAALPNGFWVHGNLLVNNGRWGVRYEESPVVASGVHRTQPTALIEGNEIHGNGYQDATRYGGASMWDAQNGMFRGNAFGSATIAGVSYAGNAGGRALLFKDSGRSDRTDLWNGDAVNNVRRGERIEGCGLPDTIVRCADNG